LPFRRGGVRLDVGLAEEQVDDLPGNVAVARLLRLLLLRDLDPRCLRCRPASDTSAHNDSAET